ncbi:hypothetical protein RJ639_003219 [Escallonia herrerae]|uniref:Reverse transcriptase Ty1/copia-type domain-containing protein n=1 Tax=Escallonia herrerae TaxID=1293975 RepID=A0AA88W4N8_9ASTE|nr:hypothetical protein RJ639_003219 [Escallonia herrerae]
MAFFSLMPITHSSPIGKGDVFLSVLMYVDDLILAGNNSTACSLFKQYLNDCFKLKDLRPLKYILGIEASPRSQHWDTALWVLRYLKAAPSQGLFLPADSPLLIYAFCDSDWASCPLTRRSIIEYFVSLGNSPISWRTKKQTTVSRSSAEVEYRSMAVTTCELTWLKSFLLSLGVHHDHPMRLFCDNQAALHIALNPVFHERTKHIEIDCHYVREQLLAGNISTAHVRTTQQVADIFTKALGRHQFHYLCGKLGIRNLYTPT